MDIDLTLEIGSLLLATVAAIATWAHHLRAQTKCPPTEPPVPPRRGRPRKEKTHDTTE
jgi:hypothetical protein